MASAGQLNIQPSGKNPDVWGVLIDENFGDGIQTVWVTASGQIRIFQFMGESPIREELIMAHLVRKLLFFAEACYSGLTPTTTCPLPVRGNIRFSIFTFTGLYTSEVEVRELAISKGNHVLANLNNSYHDILFLNNWGRLQSPISTSLYEWRYLVGQQTPIYSKPDFNSALIAELMSGEEIELGAIKEEWLTVTLPNGQWGYMSGKVKSARFEQWTLLQKEANVHAEPSTSSPVLTQLKKGADFYVFPGIKQEGKEWIKIRDTDGNEGFIGGQTRGKKV